MKRIFWTTNIILPIFSETVLPYKTFHNGSWMVSLFKEISKNPDFQFYIFSPSNQIKEIKTYSYLRHKIILFPAMYGKLENYIPFLTEIFQSFDDDFKPDIIHCHGSEYPHSLAMLSINTKAFKIISIQGLISLYKLYYFGGLGFKDLFFYRVISPISTGYYYRKFSKLAQYELESFAKANIILGRTLWDKEFINSIKLTNKYKFMPEFPNDLFSNFKWNKSNFDRFSILITQATYPIKGFHVALRALKILIKLYPNIKLIVAGQKDYSIKHNFYDYLKLTDYDKFIISNIKKYNLGNNIIFTGEIKSETLANYLSKVNLYLNCSFIENSPNSILEALIVGTPILASNVGGVIEISKEAGFATFDPNNVNDLCSKIKFIFDNPKDVSYNIPDCFNKKIGVKLINEYYKT